MESKEVQKASNFSKSQDNQKGLKRDKRNTQILRRFRDGSKIQEVETTVVSKGVNSKVLSNNESEILMKNKTIKQSYEF